MRGNHIQHKTIPKILTLLLLIFSISVTTIITQPLQVHAAGGASGNSDGDDTETSGSTYIPNGVGNGKTGYLCYLLWEDGRRITENARHDKVYALRSTDYEPSSDYYNIMTSRKGHRAERFSGKAPWNCQPWEGYGGARDPIVTYEPQIKTWMLAKDEDGVTNCQQFIKDYWGEEAAHKFEQEDYILVIETMMAFQYARQVGTTTIQVDKYDEAGNQVFDEAGNPVKEDKTIPTWESIGAPVVGTIPQLVVYKLALEADFRDLIKSQQNDNPYLYCFDKFILDASPKAEYIQYSEAGFVKYEGSYPMNPTDIITHGVAMMIYHYADLVYSTVDI